MDSMEQTVRRMDEKLYAKDKLKYSTYLTLAVAFGVCALLCLFYAFYAVAEGYGSAAGIVPSVLCFILAVFFFFAKENALIEFDYIVEDNTLTFAKIKNLRSRKELAVLPLSTVKRIEPYNRERFMQLQAKKIDCTSNPEIRKYILIAEKNGEQLAIIFEPNMKLLQSLQKELNQ